MKVIEKLMSEMTIKEKVYQTVIQRSENYIYDEQTVETKLKDFPIGGFFVGEEIIGSKAMKGDDIINAIKRAEKYSKIPPIICADTEFGCGYMFPDGRYSNFPWQMTLGATANTEYAYEFGKYTAIPAREIGVNLSLGPVCDLNINFLNPVVNTRAIGDDAKLTKDMLVSMVQGMQAYGMGATVKHFPGDGVDYRDQHFVLTNNSLSVEEWKNTFGEVYKSLIEAGVLCVMAGHISFSSYQKERIEEIAPPATLSKELICGLLKGELGFKYAVMSDAVCMNAFRTIYCDQVRSEIECFKAGVDLLLWPSEEYPIALENAVKNGEIPIERLNDAVERILSLKYELGLFGDKSFKTDSMDGVYTLDKRIAEAGVTLVRDRKNFLPQTNLKKIAIVGITPYDEEIESLQTLKEAFENNGVRAEIYNDDCHKANCPESVKDYDMILYCTFCHQHKPCGALQILPSWQVGALNREKSVVVAFGSPYLINANFPTINTAIATYSNTVECQRAVAKAILGQISFQGKLPVKLQEIY